MKMSSQESGEEKEESNPMTRVKVSSVILNICVGESGERLNRAATLLEQLTGQKPSIRRAKKTIKSFGIKRGEPIACVVTVRGKRAEELLDRLLDAVNRTLRKEVFSTTGVFSFGIKEHLDIPGTKYDPKIGVFGMDVCVNLEKPGYRVAKRRRKRSRVGRRQRVSPEEAIRFMIEKYNVKVV